MQYRLIQLLINLVECINRQNLSRNSLLVLKSSFLIKHSIPLYYYYFKKKIYLLHLLHFHLSHFIYFQLIFIIHFAKII